MSGPGSGPVQLISIDDGGKCHLQDDAVEILSSLRGKVAVIGIAGLYRTGKSFLLNRLLGSQGGFEIGPSVNPCTKGIWIWGQPIQLAPNYHCILLDTEGLGSTQRTASCDMQIFSLCVLLSSYFIYNSMGAIDEQALDDLHLVLNLAKNIHAKSHGQGGGAAAGAEELAGFFPSFLWVLRDFHLELVDRNGAAMSERDYLEGALRPCPNQDDKNRIRDTVRDLFRDRDCVTLARPAADEAELRRLEQLPYESLRPRFRGQMDAFVRKVYGAVAPKQIKGTALSGEMFVSMVSEYCRAINSSAVPAIQSAWSAVVQQQLRCNLREAKQLYRSLMQTRALAKLPIDEDELQEIHKLAKIDAFKLFLATKFDREDRRFQEYHEELAQHIKQLREQVRVENMESSRRSCQRVAAELYGSRIERKLSARGSYQSFEQLTADWEQLREEFLRKSVGPAQTETQTTWLFQRLTESVKMLSFQLQDAADERYRLLQRQYSDLGTRQRLAAERTELVRQLEGARRRMEESPPLPPPAVPVPVAHAMLGHFWRRARLFVGRALHGAPCRLVDHRTGRAVPGRYAVDKAAEVLAVHDLPPGGGGGGPELGQQCFIRDIRSIWVCADSELARCVHRVLRHGAAEADPGRIVLIDTAAGSIGLVLHGPEAREEFLDGMAMLMATQRLRSTPALGARAGSATAQPRPPGLSLQTVHISDELCSWLARAGGGLQAPPESRAETDRALRSAAGDLAMEEFWPSGAMGGG